MTPPVAQAVSDPLHSDSAVSPTDPAPPAPVAVAPATANPSLPPPTLARQTPDAPVASAAPNPLWGLLHVVAGIGYNFGGKIAPDANPFNSAAPSYSGPSLFLQPSLRVFRDGLLSLRAGLNLELSFLSVPRSAGSEDSSIRASLLAALGEVNYDSHPVGIGGSLSLGWLGLSGVGDVGSPFLADLGWASEGGLSLGMKLYAHALNQKVRAGISLDMMPGGFSLATAPGQPDLLVNYPTTLMFFVGGDVGDLVRKVAGVDSSSTPPATSGR